LRTIPHRRALGRPPRGAAHGRTPGEPARDAAPALAGPRARPRLPPSTARSPTSRGGWSWTSSGSI